MWGKFTLLAIIVATVTSSPTDMSGGSSSSREYHQVMNSRSSSGGGSSSSSYQGQVAQAVSTDEHFSGFRQVNVYRQQKYEDGAWQKTERYTYSLHTDPALSQRRSKCTNHRQREQSKGVLGNFRPRCDQNGDYESRQCQAGFCWCVDRWSGTELPTSKKRTSEALVECIQEDAPSVATGNVQYIRETFTGRPCDKDRSRPRAAVVGLYIPQCDEHGKYQQRQCHSSTGYCWCVEKENNREIPGTRKSPGSVGLTIDMCESSSVNYGGAYRDTTEMPYDRNSYRYNREYYERYNTGGGGGGGQREGSSSVQHGSQRLVIEIEEVKRILNHLTNRLDTLTNGQEQIRRSIVENRCNK